MRNQNKINIKARINRHLRILRASGKYNRKKHFSYSLTFIFLFIVVLFPVYPSLAGIVYNNTEYDFYRGDIDESSIIDSYYAADNLGTNESYIKENIESFVSIDTILKDKRDTEGSNEIINYTVRPGDSYESIALDFGITKNTILWANNFSARHVIHPGNVIQVPPVSGLIYVVKKGDNIPSIAKKYKIDGEKIKKQNGINQGDVIKVGQKLILPGAKKIIPKPVSKPKKVYVKNTSKKVVSKKSSGYSFAKKDAGSSYSSDKGTYKLRWRPTKRTFAWGNCTYFVSHYKDVTWRGNANQWIRNARAKGVPTGRTAKPGAIVQFTGRGYNPYYGHVGIVTKVTGNSMIVADMNYRRLNEVTYRKVPLNHSAIDGYIYAN